MLGPVLLLASNGFLLAQVDLREERAGLLATDSAFALRASQALLPALRYMLDEDVMFLDPGERTLFDKVGYLTIPASHPVSQAATQGWGAVGVDGSAYGAAGDH